MKMIERFKDYLETEKRRSSRTVESYIQNLKAFRRYIKRDPLLISENGLRRYKKYLLFKKLKSTTINQALASIKTFYSWLVMEQMLAKNPVSQDLFFKIEPPGIIEIPTSEEIKKIIDVIQYQMDKRMLKRQMKKDLRRQKLKEQFLAREEKLFNQASLNAYLKTLRDKLLISTLASSGLRISELLKLTTNDVEEDGSIRVRQGKGNKDRYSFMDKRSREIYKEYASMLGERGIKRLFQFTYRQAWNLIKSYVKKAGIAKNLRPHSFRHYFITTMGIKGMSDSDLSKFTGHKNVNVLNRYKNYSLEAQKAIYERFTNKTEKALAI